MIKTAIIGLGKMGISHCAILGAHPDVNLVAVCDSNSLIQEAFKKLAKKMSVYSDYKKMIHETNPQCLFVVTPTKFHAEMVIYALERGIHVFCEKPFALKIEEGEKMIHLAKAKNLVNQVGYHNRFIGTFNETKRLLKNGILGECYHFLGEAYGPVVLKEKGETWRAERAQGGGCLFDYASHVLNLIDYIIGKPIEVKGTLLKRIYSKEVEDAVYASLTLENGLTGQLSVNWSDDTYRKMSTSLKIEGTKGKMIVDATELKIYLKEENKNEQLPKGWSVKYITELTPQVNFNLRGEEYSAQVDYFIECIKNNQPAEKCSFETAFTTDIIINKLILDASK
jgi:predicted dehydrogenase